MLFTEYPAQGRGDMLEVSREWFQLLFLVHIFAKLFTTPIKEDSGDSRYVAFVPINGWSSRCRSSSLGCYRHLSIVTRALFYRYAYLFVMRHISAFETPLLKATETFSLFGPYYN